MDKWIRSSACKADSPMCAEVMFTRPEEGGAVVLVRNSTEPETEVAFTRGEWSAFLEGAKRGDFDLP